MSINVNHEPRQIREAFKFIAGLTALFGGLYVLSNSGFFKAKDFQNKKLKQPHLDQMQLHNTHHLRTGEILSLVSKEVAAQIERENAERFKQTLDEEVKDLPKGLAHKHSS